ncbi:MAG: shikimate dehydrogenase [Candidatus Diapherotrites archaeon]|nr:shikimate dehydrogenase [Candidatus Diapherotrites archaeon]
MIDANTKIVCLLGNPARHSLSPQMHNAAFRALSLNMAYIAFEVEEARLGDAVNGMRALGFSGANVTIPFKEKVIPLLDRVEEKAAAIGAVNTIQNKKGRLVGFNTDWKGAVRALKEKTAIAGKSAAVCGAGGAGRAICFGLLWEKASEIKIFDADTKKAGNLAGSLEGNGGTAISTFGSREEFFSAVKESDIVVNASPVGMHPLEKSTPVPKESLGGKQVVFDVVYNPAMTRLLSEAKENGCRIVPGQRMLLFQGAESFSIWTGKKAPLDVMEKALDGGKND